MGRIFNIYNYDKIYSISNNKLSKWKDIYLDIWIKIKIQSGLYGDIELTFNDITTHRVDDSYTALFKPMEQTFISIGKGEGNGAVKETMYKMDTLEKNLLRNFLEVRNQGLLFNKTNVDKNGYRLAA